MAAATRWEDVGLKAGLLLAMGLTAWGASSEALRPLFVGGAFVSGGILFRLWKVGHLSLWGVLGLAYLLRLLFFPLLPGLSDDAFRYVWDGLVQDRGMNPYLFRPEELALQEESLFDALNSPSYYSVYPPLSQWIFFLGAQGYGWGWEGSYFLIKAMFAVLEGAGLWFLSRIAAPRMLLLYACHPLVIVAGAGQGHTEAALVFFLIATCWAAMHDRGAGASIALAGATLVKLYPVVLFPFLWQRFGWRGVWPGVGAMLLVSFPYAHPDVLPNIASSLQLYVQFFEFNAGLYFGMKELLLLLTGADWSESIGLLLQLLFLVSLPVLYLIAARHEWPLWKSFLWTLGAYLVCSTTVHPWYLLAVLPLTPFAARPSWHWHGLGLLSLGTYLLYTHDVYWPFVWMGWSAWLILAIWKHRLGILQAILRRRARGKAQQLLPRLPKAPENPAVLDLGAAEGYVGAQLEKEGGARLTLADVRNANRTKLPHVCYDGRRLPFEDNRFDAAVLYFVLHHCEEPDDVLREALRVSRQRVLVVESTFRHPVQRRFLEAIDRLVSVLRFGLSERRAPLHYRTPENWKARIEAAGGRVVEEKSRGGVFHPQVLFTIEPVFTQTGAST